MWHLVLLALLPKEDGHPVQESGTTAVSPMRLGGFAKPSIRGRCFWPAGDGEMDGGWSVIYKSKGTDTTRPHRLRTSWV